jgi:hypothetical protein
MKFLVFAAVLASATAFTTQPSAFSSVGGSGLSNVFDSSAHRTRRATIVMDGKANGMFYVIFILTFSLTYVYRTSRTFTKLVTMREYMPKVLPSPTPRTIMRESMLGKRKGPGQVEPAKSLFHREKK